MKGFFKKVFGVGIVIAAIYLLGYGLSWIITCGIIKLITLCFGWKFSWGISTGIWLVICLLKQIFTNHNHTHFHK